MSKPPNQICCKKCGSAISVQDVLKALRPNGYLQSFRVEDLKTGDQAVLWEPDINPFAVRILADSLDEKEAGG